MKSSRKFIPSQFAANFNTWAPSAFEAKNGPEDEAKVAEILAIFNSLQSASPQYHSPKGTQSYIQGGVGCQADCWAPEEINWVPPFNTQHWNTWDEIKLVEAHNAPAKESDLKLPTTEEEKAAILADAHAQAEEILAAAQKNAEETQRQAQEEMRRSIEEGFQQGWQTSQTEAATVIRAAHEVVAELIRWREDMLARSEDTVITMIRDIARFMFGDGVKLDETGLQMNLSRVLENAKSLGDVRIFLNPGDAIRLDPAWKEYQTMLSGNKIIIVPSEGIKPGGCFVQGETGSIDARVEAQLGTALGVFDQSIEV